MKLKEKCIYYNPVQSGYYLVLSSDDEMIYGRRGLYADTSFLEYWINRDEPDLGFKIGDIVIYNDYIRNYFHDEKDLDSFEFVRELTSEEFNLIDVLCESTGYTQPEIIDIEKAVQNSDVPLLVNIIKEKEAAIEKLKLEIFQIDRDLYKTLHE